MRLATHGSRFGHWRSGNLEALGTDDNIHPLTKASGCQGRLQASARRESELRIKDRPAVALPGLPLPESPRIAAAEQIDPGLHECRLPITIGLGAVGQ